MSTIRDSSYPASSRYRKSPPNLNAHSGAYNPSQSSRLPPLSSAFAGPYSDSQHETLSTRMSPSRNSEAFAPSFQPAYWSSSNGHTTMAGHPPYNYAFEHFEPRHQTQTSSYPGPLRQSPGISAHQENMRRAPPISIPQPRDEAWASNDYINSSYPPGFGLNAVGPEAPGINSPTYPSNYDALYHSNPHSNAHSSFHPTIDTRGHHSHSHAQHAMHFPQDVHPSAHQAAHRSSHTADYGISQRPESHLVSPYSRTQRESSNPSPQEPSPVDYPNAKKKRKRADAAQLKVLNEVYARTAFPTTEERLELSKRLDMSARSVQIWFQNKRQSTRQSRASSTTLPPIMHHQYQGGPSSTVGSGPSPGPVRPGAEISVSPANHGGSYTPHSSAPVPHRSHREISPPPPPPSASDAYRRARSPEVNTGRPKRQPGYPY